MNHHKVISIDLAKRVHQVCIISDRSHKQLVNKSVKSSALLDFMRNQPPCKVAMEACGGSHYWARQFIALGHDVMLIPPQSVTPFRQGHKTDRNDALAIAEAARRPSMHSVAIKNKVQQELQSMHRLRELMTKQRTQLINQLHGLLLEYGIACHKGQRALVTTLLQSLEMADNELSDVMRALLHDQLQMLYHYNDRIDQLTRQLEQYARSFDPCRRLMAIEGVGPIVATQLYCAIGDGSHFHNGRQAAAYLGLTPKQHSSGGKARLVGIGRGGHPMLKAVLIRGAHSVILTLRDKRDRKSTWLRALLSRRHHNVAAIALANKTVRTAWALLRYGSAYEIDYQTQAAALA